MSNRRQLLLHCGTLAVLAPLAGCGFQLRQAPTFAFQTLFVTQSERSWLVTSLRQQLEGSGLRVFTDTRQLDQAEVVLDILQDQREKGVVALNASSQVREYQLRLRLHYKLRTRDGLVLLPETELLLQRDFSFNDSYFLSKEIEEQMQYRDMQTDMTRQLVRRLAAVRQP
jgi:LPS-assembly lipoprotein